MNRQTATYHLISRSFFAEQPPLLYLFVAYSVRIILYEYTALIYLYLLIFITFLTGILFLIHRTLWLGTSCILTLCCALGFILIYK